MFSQESPDGQLSEVEESVSDFNEEDAVSGIKEAKLKEEIRLLTGDFTLSYKDIKDDKRLSDPPLLGVTAARIKNIIKNKRQYLAKREKEARERQADGNGEVPPKRKRGFTVANLPENEQSVNKR